jgi:hypothetical protein
MIRNSMETEINFKAICPNHVIRDYYWFSEMDKEVIVKEEKTESDI